jgi:hypothetical protein
MHNLKVAIVDCSYVFRQLRSNNHQAIYQEYKKEIAYYIA